MREVLKKSVAMLVCLALMIGMLPICYQTVKAETYSGKCGDDVYWELDTKTGVLSIFGNGEIYDYYDYKTDDGKPHTPWNAYDKYIFSVKISAGITSIGNDAFYNCRNLTSVTIPNSVISIGDNVFSNCDSLTDIIIPEGVTEIGGGHLCIVL